MMSEELLPTSLKRAFSVTYYYAVVSVYVEFSDTLQPFRPYMTVLSPLRLQVCCCRLVLSCEISGDRYQASRMAMLQVMVTCQCRYIIALKGQGILTKCVNFQIHSENSWLPGSLRFNLYFPVPGCAGWFEIHFAVRSDGSAIRDCFSHSFWGSSFV